METLIEVSSKEELLAKINATYGFGEPETYLEITKYGNGDQRIGWKESWIVCGKNGPIGFLDGYLG